MSIIKKFKDYFKSKPEVKPKDPRVLDIESIKQYFQVLTDSATEIRTEHANFSLYDDKPYKVGARSMRTYPCVTIKYLFMGDEVSDFQKCAKWADKAADIFESETEFNAFVSSEKIEEWVTPEDTFVNGSWIYNNPSKEIIGYSIDISIINKRIPAMQDIMYRETFYYEKDENNISSDDNKRILKFVEDNLMWDFKDNDIDYSIYGRYDFSYNKFKGVVIQIFKHDNPDIYRRMLGEVDIDYQTDFEQILTPIIKKVHQKLNLVIKCGTNIEADESCITIEFNYLSSEINL